jgi:CheY-like chemotaxis protein
MKQSHFVKSQIMSMLNVLLVEDNPGDVGLVRDAVRTLNVPTALAVATDGDQALRSLRNSRFDLVILDLNLPKRNGQTILQLCALLKHHRRLWSLVVLIVKPIESWRYSRERRNTFQSPRSWRISSTSSKAYFKDAKTIG